jgi:hypothetical protein
MKTPALKFYNVSIDYRAAGRSGCAIRTIKAASNEQAIAVLENELRETLINLKVVRRSVSLSGWNR